MKPCVPEKLPLNRIDWGRFVTLIGQANGKLAEYNATLRSVPNSNLLITPLTTREAVLSSRIEGTITTVVEVYEYEAEEHPKKNDDIQEVINYRRAISDSVKWLQESKLTVFLVRKIHEVLLDSTRGQARNPGKIRETQNYIGQKGTSIEQARFIPPSPELVQEYLENLVHYMNYDNKDFLVQVALVHAQFEIIHPFDDGNGRVGRILIPLFLFEKGLLDYPNFYISEFLEARRQEYNDRLLQITESMDWEGWIEFFLEAVIKQAESNTAQAKRILDLYDRMKVEVQECTRSQFTIRIIDTLFTFPIFNTATFVRDSGIQKPSVNRLLNELTKANIIRIFKKGMGRTPATYLFPELLEIVK